MVRSMTLSSFFRPARTPAGWPRRIVTRSSRRVPWQRATRCGPPSANLQRIVARNELTRRAFRLRQPARPGGRAYRRRAGASDCLRRAGILARHALVLRLRETRAPHRRRRNASSRGPALARPPSRARTGNARPPRSPRRVVASCAGSRDARPRYGTSTKYPEREKVATPEPPISVDATTTNGRRPASTKYQVEPPPVK